jgi:hypothetical protein
MTRRLALALALLAASATAAPAQPTEELRLPEALDRAFREMMEELKPALDDAFEYMQSFGAVDDPRHYELPQVLPNGDIIIRRRDDAPPFDPDGNEDEPLDLPIDPGEGIRI